MLYIGLLYCQTHEDMLHLFCVENEKLRFISEQLYKLEGFADHKVATNFRGISADAQTSEAQIDCS